MAEKDLSELSEELRRAIEEVRNFGNSISSAASTVSGAYENNSNAAKDNARNTKDAAAAQDKLKQSAQQLKEDFKQVGKQVHNAAMDTSSGMTKYSAGLTAAGDAVGEFAGQFGPAGKALQLLIKGFTLAAEAVMKQNDAIFKSYDELGKFGATLGLTTNDVLNLGLKAGFSSKNLEGLYKAAKSLDTSLVALGGSASGGVKAFAEIANIGDEARNRFRALGYSQEEVTEMQADYVKELGKTGGALAKTPKQLSQESQKYIENLTALAELTGKSVKEQKQAREMALAQQNLNAFINDLERKRAMTTDAVEKERLGKQIESTKAYAAHIVATEDNEIALAKLQSMATNGSVVLDKNNAMLAQNGYEYDKVNEALRRGETPMKMMFINAEQNAKVGERARATYGDNLFQLGEASVGLQKLSMQTNKSREQQAVMEKYNTLSLEEKKKVDKMTMDEAVKYLAQDKANQDGRNELRNQQEQAEREYRKTMDELTALLAKAVNPVLQGMFFALKQLSLAMRDFIEWFDMGMDMLSSIKEGLQGFMFWLRDNAITRKMLGLTEVTAQEKKDFEAQKALRQKEIEDRRDRRFGDQEWYKKEKADREAKQKEEAPPPPAAGAPAPGAPPAAPAPGAPPGAPPAAPTPGRPPTAPPPPGAPTPGRPPTAPTPGAPPGAPVGRPPTAPAPGAPGKPPGVAPPVPVPGKPGAIPGQAEMLAKLTAAGITDRRAQANILAQVKAESGGVAKSESLKYTPERLLKMFPKYFKDLKDAQEVVSKGEEAIGNRIYGGRMGNTADEGYKYRGRGLIQLTGKDNYEKYGKLIGVDLVKDPDLANDPDIAQKIAVEYFKLKGKTKDLTNIAEVGKAVGYVDIGGDETKKRAQYASSFLEQIPQAAKGGIFEGPESGFPVALHGSEIVAPLDPNSLVAKLLTAPMSELQSQMQKMSSTMPTVTETAKESTDTTTETLTAMVDMLAEKLDAVIDKLSDSNTTQDKLLKYSLV